MADIRAIVRPVESLLGATHRPHLICAVFARAVVGLPFIVGFADQGNPEWMVTMVTQMWDTWWQVGPSLFACCSRTRCTAVFEKRTNVS